MEHYYNKILLWNQIGNEIINFGTECGLEGLMDFVDMNCGAVAVGEYSSVIDPDAASQFLTLYAGIAHKRLAMAVTQVCRMGPKALEVINNFIFQVGKNNGGSELHSQLQTPDIVYNVIQSFLLQELPGTQSLDLIQERDDTCLLWVRHDSKLADVWTQADGDFCNYLSIINSFVSGLLEGSGWACEISPESVYKIYKIVSIG